MSTRPVKGRLAEQEAVNTTIVGGRPPGCGRPVGPIPRGIEVLVKKAAVDAEFKQLLLEKRADAARDIDLRLEPAVAEAQLEAIIARTTVHPKAARRLPGQRRGGHDRRARCRRGRYRLRQQGRRARPPEA